MFDVSFLGAEEDGVLDRLRRLAPVLKRVLLMSSDGDTAASLEKQFAASGISVRRVSHWQEGESAARELYPQVVVIHLSPRCFGAFQLMSALRDNPGSVQIPLLFLLDASAHPRDIAFFTAGVRTLATQQSVGAADIASHLSINLKVTARETV
jgi:PleD family two-component response regulator